MCTSFISRKGDTYIAMNFDNNGMKYIIDTKKPGWFIVYVNTGKIKSPSFGIHKNGMFFNNLCVDSNGKGDYRRIKGVTHTTKLIANIIDGKLDTDNLNAFLSQTEIVNVPDWSTHNMICDEYGNVWIIEPGRGNMYNAVDQFEFCIMTNTSLLDAKNAGKCVDCFRYETAEKLLKECNKMNVDKAFSILDAVKQDKGEWLTDFSMVFSKKEQKVYYCQNHDFSNIKEYQFL